MTIPSCSHQCRRQHKPWVDCLAMMLCQQATSSTNLHYQQLRLKRVLSMTKHLLQMLILLVLRIKLMPPAANRQPLLMATPRSIRKSCPQATLLSEGARI